ncbi:probable serine/threonine-protein kinase kinX [Zootermopsis nevadensis]|uniref:Zonadhesin n=1 Tax=Zootermopsis nevadensis TaxID=136037 RepID=A0A067RIR3_ZOONE|nr:probable serine/threonine-protein kinase kinX [Zootermopsis nevadensis]KDR23662.1 hypothetical protein L798_13352 [Zootermopsis nevadensis]
MKLFVLTLALMGSALSMPVGVEHDHPRSVVPLVITDYSSVASKNTPDDTPLVAPKEPVIKEDELKPEEKPAASEDKPETSPALPVDNTNPANDASAEKPAAPASDNQEAVSSDSKPAEVPSEKDKVPEQTGVVSEKKEDNAEAEASSSQDAPVVIPEKKVSDEIKPPAPVALNVPKNDEKADESSSSDIKPAEETKEQQIDDKKVKTEEIKPDESESPAAEIQGPVTEKPLDKVEQPIANEEVKESLKVDEPIKGEAQETPVTSRRKRSTDGKEDEKKKPTEVTKKEKDEKKVKADDTPVKIVEVILEDAQVQEDEAPKIDDPNPEGAASEIKPVELLKPSDIPDVKPEVPVNEENKPVGLDVAPVLSPQPEASSDNAEIPAQIDENKNVEGNEEKKIQLTEVEKAEKVGESKQQETKIVPEAVAKDAEKTADEAVQVDDRKTEVAVAVASVVEQKKGVTSDAASADSAVEKQEQENVPATTNAEVVNKNPEPAEDNKQSEEKEGVKGAVTASS